MSARRALLLVRERGTAAALTVARSLARPPVLGAAYVSLLAIWAARTPPEDPQQLGAQAHRIEAVVEGRFGHEIGRLAIALVATAIVYGLVLGLVAQGLVALRERLHPAPASASAPAPASASAPAPAPAPAPASAPAPAPAPASASAIPHAPDSAPTLRLSVVPELAPAGAPATIWLLVLALVVFLHATVELWAMADDPQLYAAAWYARGGWRRTVQVLASDVLHPTGVVLLGLVACALFLAGPPSQWPRWPERVVGAGRDLRARAPRLLALAAMTLTLAVLADVLGRLPSAHARAGAAGDDTRPNVLVLAADSLRADRLDPRTAPHLSALADRGTRFDRTYVSLPRTFPSWVTWLTGRHPHHHGIRSMFPRWEERARDFDTLPERLGRAGWATGVASDYAGDIFSRIDLGFGTVHVPEFDFRQLVRQRVLERETPLLPVLHSRLGRAAFPVMREMNDAADPQMLARDAVRTMRSLEARGPFFLVVFFSTAHFPYAAPSPFYERFTDPSYRGRFKYDKPVGLGQEAPADRRDEAQVRGLYDGAVTAIDDAAQRVLDALEADGLSKNTIVVVTGDHGETLYDHGHGQGHGDHLFGDEGTHVPLVVVDPRSPSASPRREGAIARDVDLAPTLYALTGVAPPADLDGRSLVPALTGQPLAPAVAYAETGLWFTEDILGLPSELRLPYPGIERLTEVDTQHGDELVLQRAMRPLTIVAKHRMVRDERYKLVYAPTRTGVRWLLFDTREDSGEERDVAAAHPDVVARLQGELWAWMRLDRDMTDRDGYLVPREDAARGASTDATYGGNPAHGTTPDTGLLRLGDDPSPQAAP